MVYLTCLFFVLGLLAISIAFKAKKNLESADESLNMLHKHNKEIFDEKERLEKKIRQMKALNKKYHRFLGRVITNVDTSSDNNHFCKYRLRDKDALRRDLDCLLCRVYDQGFLYLSEDHIERIKRNPIMLHWLYQWDGFFDFESHFNHSERLYSLFSTDDFVGSGESELVDLEKELICLD